jgi:hypothetical protein
VSQNEQKAEGCGIVTGVNGNGELVCVTAEGGVIKIPAEFNRAVCALSNDLNLAFDCLEVFGGIPIPIAKAILRNLEPAHAALDLALKQLDGKAAR